MTAQQVKLLVAVCGRCGNEVVGDNTGDGRAWQHLAVPDDHPIMFGEAAPVKVINGLAALEEILDEEVEDGLPAPGTPTPTPDELHGGPKAGMRQMLNLARRQGFEIQSHIVTGPVKIGTQHDPRGYRYVDSLRVAFAHPDGRRAMAIWERLAEKEGATFGFLFAMHPGGGGLVGSPGLKAYLKSAP